MRHKNRFKAFIGLLASVAGALLGTGGASAALAANPTVPNDAQRGSVIVYKYDAETGLSAPQGGGDLAGSEFTLTNKSDAPIVYHDENGHTHVYAVGESWTITTKWDSTKGAYVASTPNNSLPQGKYHIQETKGSAGYGLMTTENWLNYRYIPGYNTDKAKTWVNVGYDFEIRNESQVVTFDGKPDTTAVNTGSGTTASYTAGPGAYNPPIRGGLEVIKRDHDIRSAQAQGDTLLRDGIWIIYNQNTYPVRVWDHFDQDPNGVLHGIPMDNYTESSRMDAAATTFKDQHKVQSWSTQESDTLAFTVNGKQFTYGSGTSTGEVSSAGGWVAPGGIVAVIRSGDDGRASTFKDALPVGWYRVEEMQSPIGYSNEERWVANVFVSNDDWDTNVATSCDDSVLRGAASFRKVDSDIRIPAGTAQGDSTMAGAKIAVYNDSDRDVFMPTTKPALAKAGDVYASGRVAPGGIVATVVTGDDGWATVYALPIGHYHAVEVEAPDGYSLNPDWKFNFTVEETMNVDKVGNNVVAQTSSELTKSGLTGETTTDPLSNTPDREKKELVIKKIDAETGKSISSVTSDVFVATFEVFNASDQSIIFMDGSSDEGRLIEAGGSLGRFTTSDETGIVTIKGIPNGTYRVQEVQAPLGYQLNTEPQTKTVTTDEGSATFTFSNQVIREDLQFQKIDDETNEPMPNVAFIIEKYAVDNDGNLLDTEGNRLDSEESNGQVGFVERHILVTDEDGMVDTQSLGSPVQPWRQHSYNTNGADEAVNFETLVVDDSKLGWEQGYWFAGPDGAPVNDNLGTFPYGKYRLTELRCAANQGKNLVQRDISFVRGANIVENIGTIANKPDDVDPCCDTSARGTNANVHIDSDPVTNSKVNGGDEITYTVTYQNTGSDTIPYLQIRDFIPRSTTYVTDSASDDGVLANDGTRDYIEWVIADVAPGATGTVTFKVKVDNNATNAYIYNQARFGESTEEIVAGDPENITPYGSSNRVTHTTDDSKVPAKLWAEKKSDVEIGQEVKVGDEVTYSITITNEGGEDAINVGITDNVPVNTLLKVINDQTTDYQDVNAISDGGYLLTDRMIAWDIKKLAPGESKTVSFTVVVSESAGTTIRNQATYGFTRGKCNGEMDNLTNILTTPVKTDPELTITKTVVPEGEVSNGERITYKLHVQNTGRGNAVNVPVYDVIPEGTQYIMGSASKNDFVVDETHVYPFGHGGIGTSDASDETPYVSWVIPVIYNRGGYIDLTYTVRVKDNAEIGAEVVNRATVGGEGPLPVTTTEPTSTDDVTVPAVSNDVSNTVINPLEGENAVKVTKTADPEDGSYVAAGDTITYTITWENPEDGHPVQGFGIRDAIPEHTTFVDGSIVLIGADGKSSTEIKDETEAAGESAGTDCDDLVDPSDNTSVVWEPRASINKSDAESIYDLLRPGEGRRINIGWGNLKSKIEHLGENESLEFEVIVEDGYDELWRVMYLPDGRLVFLLRIITPNAEDGLNYTIANGARANYDQKWKDVWALVDELKPGESGSLTFTVKVDEDVEDNVEIKNHATYGSGVYAAPCFDLPYSTNETTHITGSPDLVGTKTASEEFVRVGDTVHYTVTVTNDGTARAYDVALFDRFREDGALAGMALVPGSWKVSGSGAAHDSAGMAHLFTASSTYVAARAHKVEPGASVTMEFDLKVVDAKDGDVFTNVASFEDKHPGPITEELSKLTDPVSVTVASPTLKVTKDVDAGAGKQVKAGDTLTYTVTIKNDSKVNADDVSMFDAIPANTTYVAGSGSAGIKTHTIDNSYTDENGEVVEDIRVTGVYADGISLASGEERSFTFKVSVDSDINGDVIISNIASAGFEPEPNRVLEFISETVNNEALAPKTALRVTETSDPAPGSEIAPGDVVTYTIEILNESPRVANDVAVFNYIPENMTYVNGSATGGLRLVNDTQSGRPALVADGLTLGDHETMTFTFQAKANQTWVDLTASSMASVGQFEGSPTSTLEVSAPEVIHNIVAVKPQLSVKMTSDPATGTSVKPGDEITYTVRVSETNGAPVSDGAVYIEVPEGVAIDTYSLAGLETVIVDDKVVALRAAGIELSPLGSTSLAFKAIADHVVDDTPIACRATVGLSDHVPTEPLPVDSGDVEHLIVAPKPELRLTLSSDPATGTPVEPGQRITYVINVANDGDGVARGVAIYDAIPNNAKLVEDSLVGLRAIDGAVVTDNVTIEPGSFDIFAFTVTVDDSIVEQGHNVTNQATCGYAEAPTAKLPIASNEIDHDVVAPDPVLSVVDSSEPEAGSAVKPGDRITYNFSVLETAGIPAHGVAVYAAVPANVTVDEASLSGLSLSEDGSYLFANGIELAGKGSADFAVSVVASDVTENTQVTFRPTAGIIESATAPLPVAGNEIEHVIVAPSPDLRVSLKATPESGSTVEPADVIDYVIDVENLSEAVAREAGVYIALPNDVTYVDRSATGGLKPVTDADGNVIALSADKLTIAGNGSKSMMFAVEVAGDAAQGTIINAQATCGFGSDAAAYSDNVSNTVSHTVDVPQPELSMSQFATPADGTTVRAGDTITYTLRVRETNGVAAHGVAVYDALPAGTEFVSASDNLTLSEDGSYVYADGIDISARGISAFTFTVRVIGGDESVTINNDASCGFATAPTASLPVAANQVSHNFKAVEPKVAVTQSADPASGSNVSAGDVITYTIRLDEVNGASAKGVALFDYVPANTTLVEDSLTGGLRTLRDTEGRATAVVLDGINLDPRGSIAYSFAVTVNEVEDDTTLTNEATAGFATAPERPLEVAAQPVLHRVNVVKPILSVTKFATPDDGSVVKPGDEITYTIKVSELAGAKVKGAAIFDELPAVVTVDESTITGDMRLITTASGRSAVVVDGIDLEAKGSKTYTFKVFVNDSAEDGEFSNRATVGFVENPTAALPVASNQVSHLVNTLKPVLAVSLESDPANGSIVEPGSTINYTIKVDETAGVAAEGVAVYAKVPDGITVDESSLRDGARLVDGAIVMDGLSLMANGSTSISFNGTVKDVAEESILTMRATAGFATAPASELPYVSAQTVHTVVVPTPVLAVEVNSDPASGSAVEPGAKVTYTAKLTETAGAPAKGASMMFELPAGVTVDESSLPTNGKVITTDAGSKAVVVTGIDLPAKGTTDVSFSVTVDETESDAILSMRATVGLIADPTAPLSTDAKEVVTNVVAAKPELTVVKTSTPMPGVPLAVDDVVEYSFTVTNSGEGDAHGVAVYDAIPEHTTYVANSAFGGLAPVGDTSEVLALGCSGIEIPAGESVTFGFAVTVNYGIDDDTAIVNRALVGIADEATPELPIASNEVVTTAVTPDTKVTLSGDPVSGSEVYENEEIEVIATIVNNAAAHDKNVNVYLPVPEGTVYVPSSAIVPSGAKVTEIKDASGRVTGIGVHIDELAANTTEHASIFVTVDGSDVDSLRFDGSYGHGTDAITGPLPEDAGSLVYTIDRVPHLSIVKSQDPGSGALVAGGDILTYSITVSNTGKSVAHKVGIYDEAPEHTRFVANSLTTDRGETFISADGLLTVMAGDLKPGESATMTFKVKIDYGFAGTIHNRAQWVSPAADPGVVPNANNESDQTVANVGGTALVAPLAATVPVPPGSYTGESNEVVAGGPDSDVTSSGSGDVTPTTPSKVTVPDVVSSVESDARVAIRNAGLKVQVTFANSDTVPEGKVISQSPKAGSQLDANTVVSIVVSDGKAAEVTPVTPTDGTDSTDSSTTTTPTESDPAGGSNNVAAEVLLPDVKVEFTSDNEGGEVAAGQNVVFTLKVRNVGKVNANDLYVKVPLPQSMKADPTSIDAKGLDATVDGSDVIVRGSLAPSTSGVVKFKARVGNTSESLLTVTPVIGQADADAVPTELGTVATKVAVPIAGNAMSGDSNQTDANVQKAVVQIVKSGDPVNGSIVKAGTKVNYTLDVTNVAAVKANDLYIVDALADGLVLDEASVQGTGLTATVVDGKVIARGTLDAGGSAKIQYSATVDKDYVGDIVNFCEWGQADEDKVPEKFDGKSNEVMYHVGTTDVELVKTADVPDGAFAGYGDVITYTIVATQKGNLKEGADVTVTDELPEGLEFVSGDGVKADGNKLTFDTFHLNPGESKTLTFKAKVIAKSGDVVNFATAIVTNEDDPVKSTSVTTHVGVPTLSVTKVSDPESGSFVKTGDKVGYSVIISNSGLVPGKVSLVDTVPDGSKFVDGSLMAKAYVVSGDAKTSDEILAAAKSADVTEIETTTTNGGFFAWLWNGLVSLFGGGSDANIVYNDVDKTITGTLDVPAGGVVVLTYDVTITAENSAEIKNVATITADGIDPVSSEAKVVVGESHLKMTKTSDPKNGASVKAGDVITYSMYITNDGTAPADDVIMSDTIPTGTSYVDGSVKYVVGDQDMSDKVTINKKDGTVSGFDVAVGTLAAGNGQSGVLSFKVTVNSDVKNVSDVNNTASWTVVDPETPDKPKEEGKSDPVVNPVTKPEGKVEVFKKATDANGNEVTTFTAGTDLYWRIDVKNGTSKDLVDVAIVDIPGSGIEFVGSSPFTNKSNNASAGSTVGDSASVRDAASQQAKAQAAAVSGDRSYYSIGLGTNNGLYYGGKALAYMINDAYAVAAMPVPAGTYTVTVDSGYTASVQVTAANSDGTIPSGATGSTIQVSNGASAQVRVPADARMQVLINTVSGDQTKTLTDTTVRPVRFTVVSLDSTKQSSTSTEQLGGVDIDKIAAGETVTYLVHTKTIRSIGDTANNQVLLLDSDGNELGKAAASAKKTATDTKKSSNLPSTAATVAGIGALACGAAALAFGGVEIFRSRKRKDEDQ